MQSVPRQILSPAQPLSVVADAGIGSAFSSCPAGGEISPLAGRSVTRRPDGLKLHPALQKLGWTGLMSEFNDAARAKEQVLRDPVLITADGTILAGFGRWRLASLHHKDEIPCIEYSFDENESLQFILAHHQPSRAWNAFIRTCLGLTQMPYFQQRAIENMRTGGKYKGSAKLPEAQTIDVREHIAAIAGVGVRNVSNVQFILARAHPRIKDALRDGRLTINRAIQFCKMPYSKQFEAFVRSTEERERKKIIRRSIARVEQTTTSPDVLTVLHDLHDRETQRPGSILVEIGPEQSTVTFTMRDSTIGPMQRSWLR